MKRQKMNKWVAIPAVIFVLSLFGTYFSYATATTNDPSYYPIMYVCATVALCAFAIAAVMQNGTIKRSIAVEEDATPVVYSEDQSSSYYCIYTTGKRRQDVNFIEDIADRIEHIADESNPEVRRQVEMLFEAPSTTPVLLPAELTGGEQVYQRKLKFSNLVDSITRNSRHFALLTFKDNSKAVVVRHEELHPA
jgi:Ca2+/H+ antiporter